MTGITLRSLTPDDAPAIAALAESLSQWFNRDVPGLAQDSEPVGAQSRRLYRHRAEDLLTAMQTAGFAEVGLVWRMFAATVLVGFTGS